MRKLDRGGTRQEWTRRAILGGLVAAPLAAQTAQSTLFAYAGCYTTAQRSARGDGIHVYSVDARTGAWTLAQKLGGLVNPSFLVLARDQRHLYSVHGDEGYASAFAIDPSSGRLSPLNRAATGGRNGVHLALDPGGRFAVVANYATGNVSVLPVGADGSLADAVEVAALPGQPGPHRIEQTGSHPHHVVFDSGGRSLLIPDKGLDRIFIFRFDAATGKLTPTEQGAAVARSGAGPRHAAFHPRLPVAWAINEISSTVSTYFWDAERGSLRAVQILSTLPAEYTGENTGAEIAVSAGGRFVYCSNRGHDSIATFSTDARTGILTPAGWSPSGGRTPRFIGFDPSRTMLCAADEQSDCIATFRADSETGRLTPVGAPVEMGSPVSIAFATLPA